MGSESATIPLMFRWVTIFLLILLPLQSTWAAMAAYCLHETGTAAQHLGHHEHQHQASDTSQDTQNPVSGIDSDCATCHAGGVAALIGDISPLSVDVVAANPSLLLYSPNSPPDEEPERPNWPAA